MPMALMLFCADMPLRNYSVTEGHAIIKLTLHISATIHNRHMVTTNH